MHKRKSLIARKSLTRNSRQSTGSAVLDPDTGNLDEGHPYWWKDLENNTLNRLPSNSIKYGQTTRVLNSDSDVEGNQVADKWWNVLNDSDSTVTGEMDKGNEEKDIRIPENNASEESMTEPVIRKKKLPLHPGRKKSRGNIFLDISNSSDNTVSSLPRNKTASSPAKGVANDDRLGENSTNKIIKQRANVSEKTSNDKSKNVRSGNELELPKRKSIILASSSEIANSAATETDVLIINEGDISVQPKAQSTVLESTTSTADSMRDSTIKEHVICKPKSALLTRRFASKRRNVFNDAPDDDEDTTKIEETKLVGKSSAGLEENVKRSLVRFQSKSTPRISSEIVKETSEKTALTEASSPILTSRNEDLKITPTSRTSQASGSARTRESSDSRNIRKRSAPIDVEKGSKVLSESPTKRQTRSSSRLKQSNAKESESISKPKSEKLLVDETELIHENENAPEQHDRSTKRNTRVRVMSESNAKDNVQALKTKNTSNEQRMVSPIAEEAEQTEVRDSPKSPRKRSSMATSNIEREQEILRKRSTWSTSRVQKQVLSPVARTSVQNKETETSRRSKRLTKLREHSVKPVTRDSEPNEDSFVRNQANKSKSSVQENLGDTVKEKTDDNRRRSFFDTSESELDDARALQQRIKAKQSVSSVAGTGVQNKETETSRRSKRLTKSRERSVKPVARDSEPNEDSVVRKRANKSKSSVQENLGNAAKEKTEESRERWLLLTSESELDDAKALQKRIKAKQSVSSVAGTGVQNKETETSRRSKRLTKSQENSVKPVTRVSESDEDSFVREQGNKNTSSVKKGVSPLFVKEKAEEKRRRQFFDTSASESDDASVKQQRDKCKQLVVAVIETDGQNRETDASKISKRLTESQEHQVKPVTRDTEPDEDNFVRKQGNKGTSSVQENLGNAAKEETEESRERSLLLTSESELDDAKALQKRIKTKQSVSSVAGTGVQNKETETSRRSKRLTKSQEHSVKPVTRVSEPDEDSFVRKQGNKNTSSVKKGLLPLVVEEKAEEKRRHSFFGSSESESDDASVQQQRNKSKQLVLAVYETDGQNKETDASKISKRPTESQEHHVKSVTSESVLDEDIVVRRQSRKNASNRLKELVSSVAKEIEQNKEDAPEIKSDHLTKTQEHPVEPVTNESELDKDTFVRKQNDRSTSGVQKGLSSGEEKTKDTATGDSKLEDAGASKPRTKDKQPESSVQQHENAEKTERIDGSRGKDKSTRLNKRSGRLSESQRGKKDSLTNVLATDRETVITNEERSGLSIVRDVSSNRSTSSSRTYELRLVTTDSESEKESLTVGGSRRRRPRKKPPVASTAIEKKSVDIGGTPKRASDDLPSKSHKSFTQMLNEIQSGRVEDTPERSGKTANETQNQLDLSRSVVNESIGAADVSKKSSVRLNYSTKLFESSSSDDSEEESPKRIRHGAIEVRETTSPTASQENTINAKYENKRSELIDVNKSPSLKFVEGNIRKPEGSPKQADAAISSNRPKIQTDAPTTIEKESISSTVNKSIEKITEIVENDRGKGLDTLTKDAKRSNPVVVVEKLREKDAVNPGAPTNAKRDNKKNTSGEKESVPNVSSKPEVKNETLIGKDISAVPSPSNANSTPLAANKKWTILNISRKTPKTPLATTSTDNKHASKGQASIKNFLRVDNGVPVSVFFSDKNKVEELKKKLERVKKEALVDTQSKKTEEVTRPIKKSMRPKSQRQSPTKQVHKAYLVNGKPYKPPKLVRPKSWVTDRLYKHLWKKMEPKYGLDTRVVSEKFVVQLANVTSKIMRVKSYAKYKTDMYRLIREMARLGIIRNRWDFYNFCHDFFPYELRLKLVPMVLPGNVRNIPYSPDKLYEPL